MQPARAQRAVQAATGLTALGLRASSTHAAAPSASTSAAREPRVSATGSQTGRAAARADAAAPLVSAAFIEERLAKSLEATDRKIAMLEAKLRDEMSKNGGDVDMEAPEVVRKSKGKGKKRERDTDGEDDEEKIEMRKRLETLEKIVAGM